MRAFAKALKNYFKQIDLFILFCGIAATIYGVILILSATKSYGSMNYVKIQIAAACIGIVAFFIISLIDLDAICDLWKYIYVLNILLIGSLLIFGTGAGETGNRSWIRFGSIGIQPAEFGKILFIITLAGHIYSMKEEFGSVKSVLLLCVHAAIPIVMIVAISHDLGMAIVYAVIFFVVLFCAGLKLRWFAGAIALAGAAFPLLWHFLREDQRERILVAFNPEIDPLGRGYQAIQSKIALGAGQLTGRGLFNGTQTQYGYLPAKQTDFIFSVAGEEFGLIGCLIIIALLTIIIARCIFISVRSKGSPSGLVCIGVVAMIIFQTFENIGMCVGLMPVIGLTLPFFSYGGSSILTMFLAIGLISSARMHTAPDWLAD